MVVQGRSEYTITLNNTPIPIYNSLSSALYVVTNTTFVSLRTFLCSKVCLSTCLALVYAFCRVVSLYSCVWKCDTISFDLASNSFPVHKFFVVCLKITMWKQVVNYVLKPTEAQSYRFCQRLTAYHCICMCNGTEHFAIVAQNLCIIWKWTD